MKYNHFIEEKPNEDPFSRVFVDQSNLEIKPFYDKITNKYYVPHPDTTHTKMIISRGFMRGFHKQEFVFPLINHKLIYSDFEILIDKLENLCGHFRALRMFFALFFMCFLCGVCFILFFLLSHFQNPEDNHELLLASGLGILIGGGILWFLLLIVVLKYYESLIRRELVIENAKIVRKGLFWTISSFAQKLILEIKTP